MADMQTPKKTRKGSIFAKGRRAKETVFRGGRFKTIGGLRQPDLMRSTTRNRGKIVSKKNHDKGKDAYPQIESWTRAIQQARRELAVQGFVAVKKGQPLHTRAKEIYMNYMKSSIARGKRAKSTVFRGRKNKTSGGLQQQDLMRSKRGIIVSKKANANGKIAYKYIEGWTVAVQQARLCLGVTGFQAIQKGSPLYLKAKEIYGQIYCQ